MTYQSPLHTYVYLWLNVYVNLILLITLLNTFFFRNDYFLKEMSVFFTIRTQTITLKTLIFYGPLLLSGLLAFASQLSFKKSPFSVISNAIR